MASTTDPDWEIIMGTMFIRCRDTFVTDRVAYVRPTMCDHTATMCADCMSEWMVDYIVTAPTYTKTPVRA